MNVRTRSPLEPVFLSLAVAGFLIPGVPTVAEALATGNLLFWTQPARTFAELFVNRTTTAFGLDLFVSGIVAAVWMTVEAARTGVPGVWKFYVLLALFGLAGPLPLFLWARERRLTAATPARGRAAV